MARGLQRISFIRLIREEERSDGWWEGERKKNDSGEGGNGAFSGKHTPGTVRSQRLNTRVLEAAI